MPCPAGAVHLLLRHDHHVVTMTGRPEVLLTAAWHTAEDRATPRMCETIFTWAPGHPHSPKVDARRSDPLARAAAVARHKTALKTSKAHPKYRDRG